MILSNISYTVVKLIGTCGRLIASTQMQHFRKLSLLPLSCTYRRRQSGREARFEGEFWKQQNRKMSDASSSSNGDNDMSPTPWHQEFYRYFLPVQTRQHDTDWFGHINNVVYYSFSDTVINHFLIRHCGLKHPRKDTEKPNIVGFMIDTRCTFKYPLNYPEMVLCGMAITKLGNSSVTYTVGMFPESADGGLLNDTGRLPSLAGDLLESGETVSFNSHQRRACAVSQCVHVFVDLNGCQKPVRIPNSFRVPFQKVLVPFDSQISKL